MHARRIELDDSISVRQRPVADSGLFRIQLGDVDALDERVEYIPAFSDQAKGTLDRVFLPAVAVIESRPVRDDHRLHPARLDHRSREGGLNRNR